LKGKVEVFLELEEVAEIEKQAKEKGISRSAWIREAVLEKLGNNKVKEKSNV
jgi:hypothetical protein